MSFSQRMGITPACKIAQVGEMDAELRSGLWNALHLIYWQQFRNPGEIRDYVQGSNLEPLFHRYWHTHFRSPLDTMPAYFKDAVIAVRTYFFKCEWYQVYDLIEFTALNGPEQVSGTFQKFCNSVLERENAGYRFVGGHITPITAPEEVNAVEAALAASSPLSGVNAHLRAALQHLSDRENPDFRNSIKESISAVEAICQLMTGDSGATLGPALALLETQGALHGALKKSFSALYGYTSDADGIRHAMLDESDLTFTDAKYMLVACTAFVNYLLGKAADLGIDVGANTRSM